MAKVAPKPTQHSVHLFLLSEPLKTETATQGTRVAEALRAYALAVAGTADDLDPEWEQAGLQHISQNIEPWPSTPVRR
jgi:hypothetical protein